jgi:hypothetical protein
MRSGKQQVKEEFGELYKQFTDPVEIEKAKIKKERDEKINEQKEDYGI